MSKDSSGALATLGGDNVHFKLNDMGGSGGAPKLPLYKLDPNRCRRTAERVLRGPRRAAFVLACRGCCTRRRARVRRASVAARVSFVGLQACVDKHHRAEHLAADDRPEQRGPPQPQDRGLRGPSTRPGPCGCIVSAAFASERKRHAAAGLGERSHSAAPRSPRCRDNIKPSPAPARSQGTTMAPNSRPSTTVDVARSLAPQLGESFGAISPLTPLTRHARTESIVPCCPRSQAAPILDGAGPLAGPGRG